MADFNPPPGENANTGFGVQANQVGERFVNKDGSFNIRKTGYPAWQRLSIYSKLLNLNAWQFLLLLITTYLTINIIFTIIYLLIGFDELSGYLSESTSDRILEVFFFSTQSFTTVGYGRINPTGHIANFVASFETMTGWLFFALVTGIYYGRFTRPRAFLHFSDNALIASFKGGKALMFRVVPYKNDHFLTNSNMIVNVAMLEGSEYHFYNLQLERAHVDALSTNWTVVHPIDETSPLNNMTAQDFERSDLEVYVHVDGFDPIFSNTVIKRTSYTFKEIIHNAKFKPMYHMSKDGSTTVLELNKLNAYELVKEA
jgi:inward rectifier potassium channel